MRQDGGAAGNPGAAVDAVLPRVQIGGEGHVDLAVIGHEVAAGQTVVGMQGHDRRHGAVIDNNRDGGGGRAVPHVIRRHCPEQVTPVKNGVLGGCRGCPAAAVVCGELIDNGGVRVLTGQAEVEGVGLGSGWCIRTSRVGQIDETECSGSDGVVHRGVGGVGPGGRIAGHVRGGDRDVTVGCRDVAGNYLPGGHPLAAAGIIRSCRGRKAAESSEVHRNRVQVGVAGGVVDGGNRIPDLVHPAGAGGAADGDIGVRYQRRDIVQGNGGAIKSRGRVAGVVRGRDADAAAGDDRIRGGNAVNCQGTGPDTAAVIGQCHRLAEHRGCGAADGVAVVVAAGAVIPPHSDGVAATVGVARPGSRGGDADVAVRHHRWLIVH